MKNTTARGFIGYRRVMEFQGIDRDIFNMLMLQAKQNYEDHQASLRFGTPVRKFKPLVYGK